MRKNKHRNDEFKFPQERRLPVGILAAGVIIFLLYFDKTLNQSESCDIFCRLSNNDMTQARFLVIVVMLPFLVWALTGWDRIMRVMLWLLFVTSIIMPIVFLCLFFCNR